MRDIKKVDKIGLGGRKKAGGQQGCKVCSTSIQMDSALKKPARGSAGVQSQVFSFVHFEFKRLVGHTRGYSQDRLELESGATVDVRAGKHNFACYPHKEES